MIMKTVGAWWWKWWVHDHENGGCMMVKTPGWKIVKIRKSRRPFNSLWTCKQRSHAYSFLLGRECCH